MAKQKQDRVYMDTAAVRDMDPMQLLANMDWVIRHHLAKYCKNTSADSAAPLMPQPVLDEARQVMSVEILRLQKLFDPVKTGAGNFEGWVRPYIKRVVLDWRNATEIPVSLSRRQADSLSASKTRIEGVELGSVEHELRDDRDDAIITCEGERRLARVNAELALRVRRLSASDRKLYMAWREAVAEGKGDRISHVRVHNCILPKLRRGLSLR